MFKKFPNLTLGLLLVLVLIAASAQGRRVSHLRDCDRFYRWMLSACTQVRIFGIPGTTIEGADETEGVDARLFRQLIEKSDPVLPDIPVGERDYDQNGDPYPKIVRFTAVPPDPEADTAEKEGLIQTPEQISRDQQLWALALSSDMAPLRAEFLTALREGTLTSSGSQLHLSGLYEERGTTVSLANMFLGFRKMAANLVWLEVDKLYHKGVMHRMLPLMKTCVTLDPTFIDAFLVGAWHLAYNATAKLTDTPYELREYYPKYTDWLGEKEQYYYSGIEFLEDGIRKNPREYKLYFDLGYGIYDEKLHNTPKAVEYLAEANRLYHDRWVPRQLYRLLGKDERYEESKKGWEDYHAWQPENLVAPRFIKLMEGAIKERDAEWASFKARAAEELAARAAAAGDATRAQEWSALAQQAREAETAGYEAARQFWRSIAEESEQSEVYAVARELILNGREKLQQKRYVEAWVDFDRARWASDEFWDEATKAMVEAKQLANEPLALTEIRQLEREQIQLDYTRHLPKSMGGKFFEFSEGTWTEKAKGSSSEGTEIIRDTDAFFELLYNHPEIGKALDTLDGNIKVKVGDTWLRIVNPKPALASKLYTPPA
ncbi:MAG: hypothetical protein IT365_28610 [Candidatus Hydrogenedentes bacterium]|nr:hypothetical protein [Candidatus Hydrogenedentota bacterium]